MGTVLQAGQGQIPSRQAQCDAGIPVTVSSETLNKVCASGMRAVAILDTAIRAGDIEVGVGGGMESMSQAPYLLEGARFGTRMGDATMRDAMLRDGLESPWSGKHMAAEATEVAAELEITRADMDRWALRSHQPRDRRDRRRDDGRGDRRGQRPTDAGARCSSSSTRRRAARPRSRRSPALEPIFVAGGSHTAGNSPGVNDGAGALVVASEGWARARGCEPLATIVATAQAADELPYLARTPALAARQGAGEGGPRAVQTSICGRSTRPSPRSPSSRSGCSASTRTASTSTAARSRSATRSAPRARASWRALVHELRRRGGGIGCAAICSGGAQGDAMVVRV